MRFLGKSFRNFSLDKFLSCAIVAVAVWYVVLCVANYFSLRPMWNDEECVFLSVKSFSPKQLFTEPLLSIQVFPRVYLFFIQQLSKLFDFHLLSLRFFSFVFMVAAFFTWFKVAGYGLKNKMHYLTFVLSWCASAPLIYYSAELKQYSMDVLAGALFLLFLYNQERLQEKGRFWVYALILVFLPALILLSYVAFFFFLFPLYNLVLSAKKARGRKKFIFLIILYIIGVAAFSALSYQYDVKLRPVDVLTREYRDHDYFVSLDSPAEFFGSLGEGTTNLFARWFAERPRTIKKIGLSFTAFGFIYLFLGFFKNIRWEKYVLKSIDTVALVLFLELFMMGVLKKYPFTVPRTSLFFCPVVLYLTVRGITALKQIHPYLYRAVHAFYLVFLIFLTAALSGIALAGHMVFSPVVW